ncbi:unnamed protein product, partial [marine sediment metagenome]
LKQFKNTNYKCSKCETRHYLKDNIYYNHLIHSNMKDHLEEQKDLISETLNTILSKQFRNNKNNKEFQDLIKFTDYILSKETYKVLNNELRSFVNKKYKTVQTKYFNKAKKVYNSKIQRNIKLIKEIIKHLEYFNYLNDINDRTEYKTYNGRKLNTIDYYHKGKALDRLRIKKSYDLNMYSVDFSLDFYKLISENKEIKEIFDDLKIVDGRISNKLLYNKILLEIEDHKNSMYQLNHGINYSDKKVYHNNDLITNDSYDKAYMGSLPFSDSGKFTEDKD